MSPNTAARRRALRTLVQRRRVNRQADLVAMLAEAGYPVTQATVSRDLDAIGAVKQLDGDGDRYAIPSPAAGSDDLTALARALAEFVHEILPSGNLVVLKTPPGAAQVVASALDQAAVTGVIGTVAGDDTILAVAADQAGGWRLAKELERIGGGR